MKSFLSSENFSIEKKKRYFWKPMFKKLHISFFKVLVLGVLGFVLGFSNPVQGSELVESWKVLDDAGYTAAKADIPTLKLFNKVDELGEGALKTKLISKLDDAELVKFSDDFTDATGDVLKTINGDDDLIRLWKKYSSEFKGSKYIT